MTRALLVLFFPFFFFYVFFFLFFWEFNNPFDAKGDFSLPTHTLPKEKEKVGRSSSSAGSLVVICS